MWITNTKTFWVEEAMMRSKENYWDEEDSTDPNEFGLDAYNL